MRTRNVSSLLHAPAIVGILVWLVLPVSAQSHFSSLYLYQRSIYLENILTPGAWLANPALASEIGRPALLTTNVMPLGDQYLFAAVRGFYPLRSGLSLGIGLLGTGTYNHGSSNAGSQGDGFSANGDFAFTGPDFQAGAAYAIAGAGAIGVMTTLGWNFPPSDTSTLATETAWGIGAGWLSPWYFHTFSVSLSVMSIGHFREIAYWEHNGKAGIRLSLFSDVLRGSIESALLFGKALGIFTDNSSAPYEAMKTLWSLQVYRIFGALLGFSTDYAGRWTTHGVRIADNGNCIHVGAELRKTEEYAFWGGYDMGISLSYPSSILHRFWFAYGW
jgi:hypothetical protein